MQWQPRSTIGAAARLLGVPEPGAVRAGVRLARARPRDLADRARLARPRPPSASSACRRGLRGSRRRRRRASTVSRIALRLGGGARERLRAEHRLAAPRRRARPPPRAGGSGRPIDHRVRRPGARSPRSRSVVQCGTPHSRGERARRAPRSASRRRGRGRGCAGRAASACRRGRSGRSRASSPCGRSRFRVSFLDWDP